MLITVLMLIGFVPCNNQLCSEKSGVSGRIVIILSIYMTYNVGVGKG